MVPPEMRQAPHVSFTQLDTYLRCPLRYRLQYVDHLEPDFVPAALALCSGIHGAAALLYRGIAEGARPTIDDVQAYFASLAYLFRSMRTLRFLLIARAGRVTRLGGRNVLRLTKNPATHRTPS